jgi:glycerophosphoryl diester phosphodiesterase
VRHLGIKWPRSAFPAQNTPQAFEYALAHGCDGFEFDVRYTSDRRQVLCHDPKVGRREIASTSYLDLSQRHRPERRVAPMPCLEDVLREFGSRAYLDIELKVAGCEEEIVSQLKAHRPAPQYLVSSFLPEVLMRLNQLDDTLPLGYICKDAELAMEWSNLPIKTFLPHYKLVSQRLVDEVHRREMKLVTWTVNRQAAMLRLANWGVDGLISDDPVLLVRTFAGQARKHGAGG